MTFHYEEACERIVNYPYGTYRTRSPSCEMETPIIKERFVLKDYTKKVLKEKIPVFAHNGMGEFIFYRTYSRIKNDGTKESWADCVIRVIEGTFSVMKDWCKKNKLKWNEEINQDQAHKMAVSMFDMNWLPAGRGLFSMGTDYVYARGGLALYNCAFVQIEYGPQKFPRIAEWIMDCLMNGVGVGIGMPNDKIASEDFCDKEKKENITIFIDDSREGWCSSVRILLESLLNPHHPHVKFDYSLIRKRGLPIKGYGGIASGPELLIELHDNIVAFAWKHKYNPIRFCADVINNIGCCVVAGNVRRSAEVLIGDIDDKVFMDLKNYDENPERREIGWMSNNSVRLNKSEDFSNLASVAELIKKNGEPGIINMFNIGSGRIRMKTQNEQHTREQEIDENAIGFNPCVEVPLGSWEVCNLAETFPTRCRSEDNWIKACKYASSYCTAVGMIPTHHSETNVIIMRNRKQGVSIAGVADWIDKEGISGITRLMRNGYKEIRKFNKDISKSLGIPEALRVTCIKPGGTIPKLVGVPSGINYPNHRYMKRRIRISNDCEYCAILEKAGYKHEPDLCSANTEIFEFPVKYETNKVIKDVSIWEQVALIALAQREWADLAVSNTIIFKEEEAKDIEAVMSAFIPMLKALSMLPFKTENYKQLPEEEISEKEYNKITSSLKKINWDTGLLEGTDEKFCDGDKCERRP